MSMLQQQAEKIATREAGKRELQVSAWIGSHWHFKRLFFNRFLFVIADMKGFKFK